MRRLRNAVIFTCLLAFGVVLTTDRSEGDGHVVTVTPPPYGYTFPAKVVRCVDGDTLDVEITKVVRIRLIDCWAAETRTRDLEEKLRGFASKANLEALAQNKAVRVHVPIEPGKRLGDSFSFGRAVGHVWLNGEQVSLSEMQVQSGFAARVKNGEGD